MKACHTARFTPALGGYGDGDGLADLASALDL